MNTPHQKAATAAGGALIHAPLNRERFEAELAKYAPGCGSPTQVPGTNGGTMPCGANLTEFGHTRQHFCPHCEDAMRPKVSPLFLLTTLVGGGNSATVTKEIQMGQWEEFCARFVNGIAIQAHCQTGHNHPLGELLATQITGDLLALLIQLGAYPKKRGFDWSKYRKQLKTSFE